MLTFAEKPVGLKSLLKKSFVECKPDYNFFQHYVKTTQKADFGFFLKPKLRLWFRLFETLVSDFWIFDFWMTRIAWVCGFWLQIFDFRFCGLLNFRIYLFALVDFWVCDKFTISAFWLQFFYCRFLLPDFQFLICSFWICDFLISEIRFLIYSFWIYDFLVSDFQLSTFNFRFLIPDFCSPISIAFSDLNFQLTVSNYRFVIADFWFLISELRLQIFGF